MKNVPFAEGGGQMAAVDFANNVEGLEKLCRHSLPAGTQVPLWNIRFHQQELAAASAVPKITKI